VQVLVEEGKIRHVGLSEVGPDQIRAAAAVVPITAIEQEWSLFVRDLEVRSTLKSCQGFGVFFALVEMMRVGLAPCESEMVAVCKGLGGRLMFCLKFGF
jgi:aryl-alcohol dehydrogenase-like predicted oxidoreductase